MQKDVREIKGNRNKYIHLFLQSKSKHIDKAHEDLQRMSIEPKRLKADEQKNE